MKDKKIYDELREDHNLGTGMSKDNSKVESIIILILF